MPVAFEARRLAVVLRFFSPRVVAIPLKGVSHCAGFSHNVRSA